MGNSSLLVDHQKTEQLVKRKIPAKSSKPKQIQIQKSPKINANFCKMNPIECQSSSQESIEFTEAQNTQNKLTKLPTKISKKVSVLGGIKGPIVPNGSANKENGKNFVQFETLFSLQHFDHIKVNWNAFIKMRNQNYMDEYQILKKIGRGGFGVVSKVKSIYTNVIRAAKVISKNTLKQEDHQKLLEQMQIMKSLDHPNIIKLYEVYDYRNQYVLLLQLSSGGQLNKRIKGKKITQKQAKQYLRQILRVLIYMHSQGIMHRDLKPDNMLFESETSDVLKIIDFGIACRFKKNEQFKARIGTPSYMAPQVIRMKYNQKCDVWSLGVIFYQMLTGINPFKGDNDMESLQMIIRQQIKFDHQFWQKYSPDCLDVLSLMLKKNPDQRPSAAELIQHQWFSQKKDQEEQSLSEKSKKQKAQKDLEILKNIRRFNFKNKLQAVVYTFIASQLLSAEEKRPLQQLFTQIDTNNDGVISQQELQQALDKKKRICPERVKNLIKIIDTNGNGAIEYTEFLAAGLSNQDFMKAEHFQKAFAYFDIDHGGSITYEEVAEFLQDYEEEQDEIQKMFKQVDVDGNGEISLDQFIALFMKTSDRIKTKASIGTLPLPPSTVQNQQSHPQPPQQLSIQSKISSKASKLKKNSKRRLSIQSQISSLDSNQKKKPVKKKKRK